MRPLTYQVGRIAQHVRKGEGWGKKKVAGVYLFNFSFFLNTWSYGLRPKKIYYAPQGGRRKERKKERTRYLL